jgi:hypothetical protein
MKTYTSGRPIAVIDARDFSPVVKRLDVAAAARRSPRLAAALRSPLPSRWRSLTFAERRAREREEARRLSQAAFIAALRADGDTVCVECGRSLPDDAAYCTQCGAPQPAPISTYTPAPDGVQCSRCRRIVPPGPVCDQCGRALIPSPAPSEPMPVSVEASRRPRGVTRVIRAYHGTDSGIEHRHYETRNDGSGAFIRTTTDDHGRVTRRELIDANARGYVTRAFPPVPGGPGYRV